MTFPKLKMSDHNPDRLERVRSLVGLLVGPIVFLAILLYPVGNISGAAHKLLAVLSLVVIFWITEPIPIPATALLGSILAVLFGVAPVQEVFAPYGDPIIFLFMGSFIVARSMTIHNLDRRFAGMILRRERLAGSPAGIIFAIGIIATVLSMWMSNTAVAAMMMPIAMCVLQPFTVNDPKSRIVGDGALVVAYAASIGGIATPVGTPPNLITMALLRKTLDVNISFFQWMLIGVPISLLMFLALFLMVRGKNGGAATPHSSSIAECIGISASRLSRGERNTLVAFGTMVSLWVIPGFIGIFWGTNSHIYRLYNERIPESAAAILAAVLLFLLPVNFKEREFTISWKEAVKISWGTILLFGGGLSLGTLMLKTGLGDALGGVILQATGQVSLMTLTAVSLAAAVVLTEFTSNTAAANIIVPVAISLAKALNLPPIPPVLGACFGSSLAFMLPISTPPNAIAYATGRVPMTRMILAGIKLDIVAAAIVLLVLKLYCALM